MCLSRAGYACDQEHAPLDRVYEIGNEKLKLSESHSEISRA